MERKPKSLKYAILREKLIYPNLIKKISTAKTTSLIVEGTLPEEQNYLIVANHVCNKDVLTLNQAVGKHFYLLARSEDAKYIYPRFLKVSGVERIKRGRQNKTSPAYKNGVYILKSGKNLAAYPENTMNPSPNLLILKSKYECIEVALESGKSILPVVTYYTGNQRYTKIGEQFHISEKICKLKKDIDVIDVIEELELIKQEGLKYLMRFLDNLKENYLIDIEIINDTVDFKKVKKDLQEAMKKMLLKESEELRNIMASMLYELMEKHYEKEFQESSSNQIVIDGSSYYFEKRDDIPCDFWDKHLNGLYQTKKNLDESKTRKYESRFIYTPENESYQFFQEFNSVVCKDENGNLIVRRITSEKGGHQGSSYGEVQSKSSFGYGYNENWLEESSEKPFIRRKINLRKNN